MADNLTIKFDNQTINITVTGGLVPLEPAGVVTSVASKTGDVLLDDEDIGIAVLGSPPYTNARQLNNITGSTGVVNGGGVVTDNGDGTVAVSTCEILIRPTDGFDAEVQVATVPAIASLAMVDQSTNFIYASYNAGAPVVTTSTVPLAEENTNVVLGIAYRNGLEMHITRVNVPTSQVNVLASRRLYFVNGIERQSGGVLSESGVRNIAVTAGDWWLSLDEYQTVAKDTSVADTFDYWYQTNGVWTRVTGQTQIDNTQYNDVATGLATLTNNRYAVAWVYLELDGDIEIVYGTGNYLLSDAQDARVPADLPPQFQPYHTVLIGKIIIQKGAAVFTEIQTPFETTFGKNLATQHSDLSGLLNDDHTQYLLADGSRAMSGDLDVGGNSVVNVKPDYTNNFLLMGG